MKYFKILRDDEHTRESDIVCKSVENHKELFDIDKNDLYSGEILSTWNSEFLFEYSSSEGNTLSDFVFNNLGWYIVSPKVQNLVRELGLEKHVQILPVKIKDKESGDEILSYAVLNIHRYVDAFDREHSDYREKTLKGKTIYFIKKFAFLQKEIKQEDIFRVHENKFACFASERLVSSFVSNEITGVDFREVKVVD